MRLKVMHLTGHLKTGGAENLITEYAVKFNKDHIEVVVVTLGDSKDSFNERKLKDNGIKVIHLGEMLLFSNEDSFIKRLVNKIYRYILFLGYVKKESPNVIHAHLLVTKYLIALNNKKLKIKLFYTVHSEVNRLFGKGRYLFKVSTKYLIKKKGMVPIALHPRMQREVNNLFNTNKCIVLNNGIDMNKFNPFNYNNIKTRESLNLKNDAFVIGHVGRFVEAKNHKFLIKVFKAIKEIKTDAILLLIGAGELEREIREQVKQEELGKSVIFLGNRSDIPELMSIMDVFVFPSLREGFGNVLIEAQAMGLKCVVSNRVPEDAFITNLVIPLGLEDSIENWCESILEQGKTMDVEGDLRKYDIAEIIKSLEKIYIS